MNGCNSQIHRKISRTVTYPLQMHRELSQYKLECLCVFAVAIISVIREN